MNETHSGDLKSWVESANVPESDFPIQNLPFGVFSRKGEVKQTVGVAIGDFVLDLNMCITLKLLPGIDQHTASSCQSTTLNNLMSLGRESWSNLRLSTSELLKKGNPSGVRLEGDNTVLVPMSDVEMHLPATIGDYTDFYASIFHATNVGSMFRPDNPLLPNYKHIPVGYHGRSSSIVVSPTPVFRPNGQTVPSEDGPPQFGPSKLLDYEMEIGFFVGPGNKQGDSIQLQEASNHIFGLCLVNDWSARDIQKWEYQPLGPFLAKNFATTISPWIVTLEALEPFRAESFKRNSGDPQPLPYLSSMNEEQAGGLDIIVEVYLASGKMREQAIEPIRISKGNLRDMYWTIGQMLTHHASNGCNLHPGDLLATGTISGSEKETRGCLLERTWRGAEPLDLPTGETRKFLLDGDEVIMRGYCEREGYCRIGFGECRGIIMPAMR